MGWRKTRLPQRCVTRRSSAGVQRHARYAHRVVHRPLARRGWHVVAASSTGTRHVAQGEGCQDRQRHELLPDGSVIVAVADGAGSAPRSAEGAQTAVDAVVLALVAAVSGTDGGTERDWEGLLCEAFAFAREQVLALAASEGVSPRAFATTLTCAVVTRRRCVVGQIGDGVVVVRADGALHLLAAPERGEYANEVTFISGSRALEQLRVRSYNGRVDALAAATDGLLRQMLLFPQRTPFAPFLEPLFAIAVECRSSRSGSDALEGFLSSEMVRRRTDDDTTLALVVRPSAVYRGRRGVRA
ncbi:MAG: serine/threonine protein phosphatase [Chloroflexi bacterium]|nr:MAG: serine/threonine protein phosphatase [Chloroflexota bacterium]